MEIIKQHHISLKNAFSGLKYAFISQPNFKIHLTLSLLVILAGFYLQVSYTQMTILVLTIAFGLGCEMINTSLESMTDLITNEWRQEAKIAKDVAAGMMLLISFGAFLVAILILGPKIGERLLWPSF